MGAEVGAAAAKRVVLEFLDAAVVLADSAAAEALVAPGYRDHSFEAEGAEAVARFQASAAAVSSSLGEPVFVIADGELVTTLHHLPQPQPDRPGEFYDYYWPNTFSVRDGKLVEAWPGINRIAPLRAPGPSANGDGPRALPETTAEIVEANKRLVLDFFLRVFEAQDAAAVADFVADDYRQHGSGIPDGPGGLERFVSRLFPDGPKPVGESLANPPVKVVGEGDIVVVVVPCLPQPDPDDPARSYPFHLHDSLRVRDGKLCEHWSGVDRLAPPRH